jgi:hypothetical protein
VYLSDKPHNLQVKKQEISGCSTLIDQVAAYFGHQGPSRTTLLEKKQGPDFHPGLEKGFPSTISVCQQICID